MADVRTFRAATMREALQIVRDEMGADAVILHTRQVEIKRRLPWSRPHEEVEITAGANLNVRSPMPNRPRANVVRPVDRAMEDRANPSQTKATTTPVAQPNRQPCNTNHQTVFQPENTTHTKAQDTYTAGRVQTSNYLRQIQQEPANYDAVQEQLKVIQKMLKDLGIGPSESQVCPERERPEVLNVLRERLLSEDVNSDIVTELLDDLEKEATPTILQDMSASAALLTAHVERRLKIGSPITIQPGKRKVVALVGATGVGKTTTIAKLAADFRLRNGIRMGLVTVDTYRIAAVEQLHTYAEILDLPMKVVTNSLEMRRALDELAGLDLVLIDTAGRSPRDELQIQELKRLLAAANCDEVQLVLSATASSRSLLATAKQFQAANATSIILSKLDEASQLGPLLSLAEEVNLPISYITTGQDVPDDIEPAQADRLARLILGRDQIARASRLRQPAQTVNQ